MMAKAVLCKPSTLMCCEASQPKGSALCIPSQFLEHHILGFHITPIMENQMDKKMDNEMETREYMGIIRV